VVVPPGTTINATTNAPNSAAVGINTGTITVNQPSDLTAPVITYFYDVSQRVSRPGSYTDAPGESEAFKKILKLNSEGNWNGLLDICRAEIGKAPKWLTPYYYEGLAQANLQHLEEAASLFKYVKDGASGNPDYKDLAERADTTRLKVETFRSEHPMTH
jgi:hypothetical protein